jgi:hypothetical protein
MSRQILTFRTLLEGKNSRKRMIATQRHTGGAIRLAVQKSQRWLNSLKKDAEALYRLNEFRPHAVILTEKAHPSRRFIAVATGAEKILRVDFDVTVSSNKFLQLALEGVKRKLSKWRDDELPGFGRPMGIVVNYLPDFAVRFDLDGTAQEIFREAYRIGQADLLAHGRPISPTSLA